MTNCPECGAKLSDDFGLVDCAQCGLALFIEFDGVVKKRDGESPEILPTKLLESSTGQQEAGEAQWSFEDKQEDVQGEVATDRGEIEGIGEMPSEGVEARPEPDFSLAETPDELASPSIDDIAAFAAKPAAMKAEGAYRYDIQLSGVDTRELRDTLKGVLQDPKFLWRAEEILRALKDGEIWLHDLSPVKAAVLIQRVQELPISIKWVQRANVKS